MTFPEFGFSPSQWSDTDREILESKFLDLVSEMLDLKIMHFIQSRFNADVTSGMISSKTNMVLNILNRVLIPQYNENYSGVKHN